jgi:UDP-GlcNAc:undecaprenyl-phosphate GlcNAc-1-phosphate transferase
MVPNPPAIFTIFEALLVSLIVVIPIAWLSIRLAWRIRLVDLPGSEPHKKHDRPTPMAGGIALLVALLVCGLFLGTWADGVVRASFLAAIPVFVFGLWDDYKCISPPLKLLGQVLSALVLIYLGVNIRIFESPGFFFHGTGWLYIALDWLITVLWVVGITNACNFVDSMDGLAVGLGGMAAAFFMLVTLDAGQMMLAQYSALLAGICMGLYFFNSPPALLFLGDTGAQTLGLLLSVLAIGYQPRVAYQTSSWFVPVMILGVPIFDTALILVSRLRHRRRFYWAALDHTYHRLLRLGLDSNRAVLVMQMVGFFLSCLAFWSLNQPPLVANATFISVIVFGCLALVLAEWVQDTPRG